MNYIVFLIAGVIAIQTMIAYADSQSEIDDLLSKGMDYFGNAEYDQAIIQFDNILKIEPNNVDALYNIGNSLSRLEKYNEAIPFFEKVLEIYPEKYIAQLKLEDALTRITSYEFGFLEGVLEIKVHDSQGGLIAYLKTTKIKAIQHPIIENLVEGWPIVKTINRNNHTNNIHQLEFVTVVKEDAIYGFHEIPFSEKVNFPLASTWHYQIPVEKGDTVNYVYSIFRKES